MSPNENQVACCMMLAMDGNSAAQSLEQTQAVHPRDLQPTGAGPVWHTLWVMNHPGGERTEEILARYDARYVVLYEDMPDRPVRLYHERFLTHPDLYRTVFENGDVLILEPTGGRDASAERAA